MADRILSFLLRDFGEALRSRFHPYLNRRLVTFLPYDNGKGSVHYVFVLTLFSDDLGKSEIVARNHWHDGLVASCDGFASGLYGSDSSPTVDPYAGAE